MIKNRKPNQGSSMPPKKSPRRRKKNNQGCCDELDHIFVACIKFASFIEVILFAVVVAAVAIYVVSTSTSGKEVQNAVYRNQYTGIDKWYVRMFYEDNKCSNHKKSSRSNGFRLNYCMPHYGTSEKILLNETNNTLTRSVYSGDLCSGEPLSSVAYVTSLNYCTKVPAVSGDVLVPPPSEGEYYKDILLESINNADPRNPTTKNIPVAFLKAEELIAPPDITSEYEVGLGRMGSGDCFVQVMEKLNHGIFVAQVDLTYCIKKGGDGMDLLRCLGINDNAFRIFNMH